ncbi:MAG: baseplate wedge protein, partial [Pseudomonadota bacterium]|nr:baseplate wedge protein [Pseudomonadota bacterium]
MPFTKFTNLDFDQIKSSIKDYIRANSNFTDFDFEGSNFSVLIDTLAYNTYITAFNSNMIVNESFLDSATLRENVVSLARNIGYVPKSRTAAQATVSFDITTSSNTPSLTLQAGLVCVGTNDDTSYVFSIPETITTTTTQATDANGNIISSTGSFSNIVVYQGTYLTKSYTVNGSLDQRFLIENSFIDTSTLK